MSSFEAENMQTQCNVLSYSNELYFYDSRITIEKKQTHGHKEINIDYKIKRQKVIEQERDCKIIRIDPDKENFDVSRPINEIFRQIN